MVDLESMGVMRIFVSMVGTRVEFTHDPSKYLSSIPGGQRCAHRRTYRFPGVWDVDYLLDTLQNVRPKTSRRVDLRADAFPVLKSPAYLAKRLPDGKTATLFIEESPLVDAIEIV